MTDTKNDTVKSANREPAISADYRRSPPALPPPPPPQARRLQARRLQARPLTYDLHGFQEAEAPLGFLLRCIAVTRMSLVTIVATVIILSTITISGVKAQGGVVSPQATPPPASSDTGPSASSPDISLAPETVAVKPVAHDEEIRKRLQQVMEATGWFTNPKVTVKEGVVFLDGDVKTAEIRKWAGNLASNTQDVTAVVNRINVSKPSAWDFSPAWDGLLSLWRQMINSLPLLVFGIFILGLSAAGGWMATRGARAFFTQRVQSKLLRGILTRGVGVLVFLAGAYVVLRVSGLTQLAMTLVGGTGLIGLAVGIAFRDITENFLASIFLSVQRPFATGDLVEVAGTTGYVQQMNVRTTILMTLDGNLSQIPNATVYKSTLLNFSANPNRREDFVVGIGYDDPIDVAQEVARKVLADHPAILKEPEPWVLADGLGSSTVNLRVYFWINGHENSYLKVRSSVIRLVKRAFQQQGISMPDEAREVVFPQGVPITTLAAEQEEAPNEKHKDKPLSASPVAPRNTALPEEAISTKAEAGLSSEASTLEEQAQQTKPLNDGENLLRASGSNP